MHGDTVWMTQKQLSDLYQVSVPTINGHLRVVYEDAKLAADRTIRKFRIVAREGARDVERLVDHYNLEVILQLGYRGAQFRSWATGQLQDYLVKGFLLLEMLNRGRSNNTLVFAELNLFSYAARIGQAEMSCRKPMLFGGF